TAFGRAERAGPTPSPKNPTGGRNGPSTGSRLRHSIVTQHIFVIRHRVRVIGGFVGVWAWQPWRRRSRGRVARGVAKRSYRPFGTSASRSSNPALKRALLSFVPPGHK